MFKKIIVAALATLTVAIVGTTAFASSYSGKINVTSYPSKYYHHCKIDGCGHYADKKYLSLNAEGKWGYVYSRTEDHEDSYKYISVTTYTITNGSTYNIKKTVRKGGTAEDISSPYATIDSTIAKVVYNGQIYYTSEKSSGVLQKYLIGSFRSGCELK